ncbi:hypothetical protein CSPX01_16545 [Colletotrichum filicis]|nr:hypothetical protein CSPX01_16545 [Colletotrichum filicis]
MVSALPYTSQREPIQQEDIPEDIDWSESESDVTRRSYRQHQRHTEPVDNFEDLASQFAWDGTYADPDSLSPHHEARFATGQTVPYRRGHLEGFADPSRHRGPPNRKPPPPGPNEPQGFSQQPEGPAMNYYGVPPPPPPPHPGILEAFKLLTDHLIDELHQKFLTLAAAIHHYQETVMLPQLATPSCQTKRSMVNPPTRDPIHNKDKPRNPKPIGPEQ